MLRDRSRALRVITLTVAAVTTVGGLVLAGPATAATATQATQASDDSAPNRTVSMPDGSTITITPTGDARRTSAHGTLIAETMLPVSAGRDALGDSWAPSDAQVRARFSQLATSSHSADVLAVLSGSTAVTGAPVAGGMRAAVTSTGTVNAAFAKLDADAISPMFGQLPAAQVQQLTTDARAQLGNSAVDLSKVVVIHLHGGDASSAAATLRATPGIAYAEPDQAISTESTGGAQLPTWAATTAQPASTGALPGNYGLTSSLQSFLNAGGVNAEGAYSTIQQRFGQLPGAGERITNVSIGDLTDQSMADAGDNYVKSYGPTTVVQNGQRYLDLPSMPLIPTYTASPSGTLDPTGSTEGQDPGLGEIMLDFGVMAPLPHNDQRADATGAGATDLLGIAPGAQYRLVVPQQPTTDQLPVALLAAARQNPRPDVITASLGYGTDTAGFPGRYLEDDPIDQAVIAAIVQEYHIVVCISANDGTRLYTPTAVGPDGGSTPTNVTRDPSKTTDINDDANSTTPSQVLDSGAIAVGGTTLDDTLAVPTQNGGAQAHNGTWAATRTDGSGAFSSGFGSRIDVSAPSDGIPAFEHPQGGDPQDVETVLNGGTSASAPMTAAAAAVVLQAARLTGQSINPVQVRTLLEHTGRAVATPPQADQQLNVGPQIDVTAAVNSVLASARGRQQQRTQIARVSVAHRQTIGELGGEFTEATDPDLIDLQGPSGTGEGLVGPVTIAGDVTGLPANRPVDYVLTVGKQQFHSATPAIRLTPTELLTAAGQNVVATTNRTIGYSYAVRVDGRVVASTQRQLTLSATDGGYAEAQAPVAPATVAAGKPVTVHYDLTGVRGLAKPELVVSTVGHPNPATAPIFTAAYTVALSGASGSITVPASAFDDGGGLYGIGIVQDSTGTPPFGRPVYGEFASIRVNGGTAAHRPAAPTFPANTHQDEISRGAPGFTLHYDVRNVPGATGAAVEFSAPSPTLYNSLNTFSNANGTVRDHDGVDAGSVAYQQLGHNSGNAQLDAVKLGLASSLAYDVRVLATDHNGHIIGQASPSSQLIFDDGITPNEGTMASFATAATGPSVVAVRDPSGAESVREYQPKTGTYGATLATDSSGSGGYDVLGVDAAAQRALLLHWSTSGTWSLATYNTATAQLVADVPGSADEQVSGGRVDTTRHRGAVLVRRASDKADLVLPVDLATGAVGTAIPGDPAGAPAGNYGLIDVDQATGAVLLSHVGSGLICFIGGGANVASVDLDAGTATTAQSADGCSDAIADDSGSGTLYQMSYRSFSVNIAGTTNLIPVSGNPLTEGSAIAVRQQPALGLAIDPVHHLALVAFQTPPSTPQFGNVLGAISDNNATSQLAVLDLTTGKTVSTVSGFNFGNGLFGGEYNHSTERAVQLDPATRTGWTYSPGGDEVQQFTY